MVLWFGLREQLDKLEKNIKSSFSKVKRENKKLKEQIIMLNSIVDPLPKQFKELQKQLSEHLMSSVSSVKSPVSSLRVHREVSEVSEPTKNVLGKLTPHTKTAFVLVTKLLNESNEEWLPLSNLIPELYPDKQAEKVRNALSNTIKPLLVEKLLERTRKANFVYIKLTSKGFNCVKNELSKAQLRNMAKFYN